MIRIDQEKDIEVLRNLARVQEGEIKRLIQKILALTQKILELQGKDSASVISALQVE